MRRHAPRPFALAALLLLVMAAPASANCGAEGCPLNPQGIESSGRHWSLDLGYQFLEQDRLWEGTHEVTATSEVGHITERFTRTRTWTMSGRAQVLPSVRLIASVPYLEREHAHELLHHPGYSILSAWRYEGLGDASMIAQWSAHGSVHHGIGALMVEGGVKLPTGRRHVEEVAGEEPEPPARLGSGSVDGTAGLQVMRHWEVAAPRGRVTSLPLVFAVMGRWNGVGTDGYRMGNELQTSVSSTYAVMPALALLGQVQAIFHGRDIVGLTDAEPHHTGGTTVNAMPGLRVDIPGGAALYGYWQARVFQRTNGPQLIGPSHWIFGASFGFGR